MLLLLLCVALLLAICVVCLVRRKRCGHIDHKLEVEVESQVHDSLESTGAPRVTSSDWPHIYQAPLRAIPTETRVEMRQSCIYCSVIRATDYHQNTLTTSLLIRNSSTNAGTTEGGDEEDALSKDKRNGRQYQSIHQDQVQVHHYASLGTTVDDEGSAQSYI